MASQFLQTRKLRCLLCISLAIIFSGCSSNSNFHDINKDIIALESIGFDASSNGGGKFVVLPDFPNWVIASDNTFDFPVGVSCQVITGTSYSFELKAKTEVA